MAKLKGAEKEAFKKRMAAGRKKAKKKGGKKARKKTGKKKRSKKKGSSKKSRRKSKTGGCPPAVAHEVKRLADATARLSAENARLRSAAASKPRRAKKKKGGKKKRSKKGKKTATKTTYKHHAHGRVSIVTAKDIVKPKVPRTVTKAWLCAGPKGTGCGGGGKVIAGARTVGRKGRTAIRKLLGS